jgi:hypothetical protein
MSPLAACSDSKPPAAETASAFNPFLSAASSAGPIPATPPGTLAIGDCFNTDQFAPGTSIDPAGVHAIACTEPQQHHVYAVAPDPVPEGAAFPGDASMSECADDVCLQRFEPAFGIDYRASTLDFASIRPTASTWATGDRLVICAAHDTDFAELTGSQLASTTTTTPESSSGASTSTSLAPESG